MNFKIKWSKINIVLEVEVTSSFFFFTFQVYNAVTMPLVRLGLKGKFQVIKLLILAKCQFSTTID